MSAVRDPAKSADEYKAFVAREQEAMQAYLKIGNPGLFGFVAPSCVRIAKALYSAGAGPAECREWLTKAAVYQTRLIVDGKKFSFGGPGYIDDYLELYAGAYLAGHSDDLVDALKQCTYTQKVAPTIMRLIAQYGDLLQGKPITVRAGEAVEAAEARKEWGSLPELFATVAARDTSRATAALEGYLSLSWGPGVEKWAKTAIKSPRQEYEGKWSLLSATVASILGGIPALSDKGRAYIPVDLVVATA